MEPKVEGPAYMSATPDSASFSAVVTDIRLQSRERDRTRWQMTLSRTRFRPGDTGLLEAVSRTGTKIEVPVIAVTEDGGDIWHTVEKPLAAGTDVVGHVTGN